MLQIYDNLEYNSIIFSSENMQFKFSYFYKNKSNIEGMSL